MEKWKDVLPCIPGNAVRKLAYKNSILAPRNVTFAYANQADETRRQGKKSLPEPDEAVLVGSWSVRKHTKHEPDYFAIWTFSSNKTAAVETSQYKTNGTWFLEPTRVRITWKGLIEGTQEHHWDTFHRPIKLSDAVVMHGMD